MTQHSIHKENMHRLYYASWSGQLTVSIISSALCMCALLIHFWSTNAHSAANQSVDKSTEQPDITCYKRSAHTVTHVHQNSKLKLIVKWIVYNYVLLIWAGLPKLKISKLLEPQLPNFNVNISRCTVTHSQLLLVLAVTG